MKTLKILDYPAYRFNSETHPFYRWRKEFRDHGIKVEIYADHRHPQLREADALIIHSRYFREWQNTATRNSQNEHLLMSYLEQLKKTVGTLVWFDAADSSGSGDFPIIGHVDVFLKKQILSNTKYYGEEKANNRLRIWLDEEPDQVQHFDPCPAGQLHKIRTGWNIGLSDYRLFCYKLNRLSNYVGHRIYPDRFTPVNNKRNLDLAFRGRLHEGSAISKQRNHIIELISRSNFQIATGKPIPKKLYRQELRSSRVSLSPFGWGEICYRDFESFLAGAILIKPSVEHLRTYPNVFIPNKTYVPFAWNSEDLEEKLDYVLANYSILKDIAGEGQRTFKEMLNDAYGFVEHITESITEGSLTYQE